MTGAELAAIRKAAGLSQTDLGRAAGIGRHAVSYWECVDEVDLRAWAVCRMRPVLSLPAYQTPARAPSSTARTFDDRLEAELAQRLAAAQRREAARAARMRVRCDAKTRKGTSCRMMSEPGKRRCKYHGGMSTGARTPEGKERIREAQRRRWKVWRAERERRNQDNQIARAKAVPTLTDNPKS